MELFEPVFHALHDVEEQAKESLLLIPPSLGRGDGGGGVGLLTQADACVRGAERVVMGRYSVGGWSAAQRCPLPLTNLGDP